MPYSLTGKLVVGISSRALFDLDDADRVFRTEGLAAYRRYQREQEHETLRPGTALPLIRGLLAINRKTDEPLVEVIVISRNDADTAIRLFDSIEEYGLDITRGAFTSGRDPWRYLRPLECSLFLSADAEDVYRARVQGLPAALVLSRPDDVDDAEVDQVDEVRIAFDGDAVLFDERSELIFQQGGLDAFQEHEAQRADVPMSPGPFLPFLLALKRIQDRFPEGSSPIRTSLVTARGAPAHRRVVHTLRSWGVRLDETFFLGGIAKAPVLAALRPHIFFDDQLPHLEAAQRSVPSAHVVPEREQLALFGDQPLDGATAQPIVVLAADGRRQGPTTEAPAQAHTDVSAEVPSGVAE